ncbi:hypothetical protein SCATT_p13150 (plasmid) [Streptantibioticus cattleyicolor NRRL 8057 = DSM 46488]|uniref:Uncharacterized protein n=1 Tax=Streptantibioticus cattleyicolor (strain ATCC 35852 / DSM 46488 / JCM 4925 / NBRC 14057 / NRRL 8057) TaxID=1003195 RepID=G8XFP7_STREN|nr:hypothetical protein SCATT_p13150 [Streptantibioticus cattleyicolor NRRL 8057 = DSM 46488]
MVLSHENPSGLRTGRITVLNNCGRWNVRGGTGRRGRRHGTAGHEAVVVHAPSPRPRPAPLAVTGTDPTIDQIQVNMATRTERTLWSDPVVR